MPNIRDKIVQQKIADGIMQGLSAEKAVIAAGYSPNYARHHACKLVAKDSVKALIDSGANDLHKKGIASAEEIQRFWTDTLNNKKALMPDRIRASELLAKAQGMFTTKVDVKGNIPVTIVDDVSE